MDKDFKERMLKKREQFFEKAHAAFILNTSFNWFGTIPIEDLGWLRVAYPSSTVETGNDQGLKYNTITPLI